LTVLCRGRTIPMVATSDAYRPPHEQGEVYDATSANPAALIAMELVRTIA
jgi:hypothetical protein